MVRTARRRRRVLSTLVGLSLVFTAAAGCGSDGSSDGTKPKEYGIGASLYLTAGGPEGGWMRDAIVMAVDEINKSGGIGGVPMKAYVEDNKVNPQVGFTVAQKFISVDKVPVILSTTSAVTKTMIPLADKHNVVILNGGAGTPSLANASKWLVSDIPLIPQETDLLLDWAYQKGLRRLSFYGQNDEIGKATSAAASAYWKKLGGTVLDQFFADKGTLDHASTIAKFKAADPDLILDIQFGQDQITFVKQARELGLDAQIISTTGFKQPNLLKSAAAAAEGSVFTQFAFDPACTADPCKRMVDDWRERYGGEVPHVFAVTYYDLVYIVKAAIEYGQQHDWPYDGEHLLQAIEAIKTFHGVAGDITIHPDGTADRPVELWTVKNGAFTKMQDAT